MANQHQVDRLKRSIQEWNEWRQENLRVKVNLSAADLRDTNLIESDLRDADLSGANLSSANLNSANLSGANLRDANLSGANLRDAYLSGANLSSANLNSAHLNSAYLSGANLSGADFNRANLSDVNFTATQALDTHFCGAVLTGACIEDWNINSKTNLQDVVCEYIFTKYDPNNKEFTDRRPHDPNQIFAPGEFIKRYQIVLETVDLFFNDGIDWKAFSASLQELKTQYGEDLNVQAIEQKAGSSFVVRLGVASDLDKGTIERQLKEFYEIKLNALEAEYRAKFQDLKIQHSDEIIALHRQHNADMREITKLLASKPITVEAKAMAENQSSSHTFNNNMQGATIGNFANTMQDQSSMQATQYIGAKLDEVAPLIQSLRGMAESFPQEQRTEALEHLEDLETDLKEPPEKRKSSRMKATLGALLAVATVVSGAVAGANEFVDQVQQLSEKLGIPLPIEQVQPQSQQPKTIDIKANE
ncbi:pentapeptide repeat-containing protein [Leptolyngbya sp. GB1-A1]|uniref:pentapeptide repeat-containing protein n=1 Tax=Leptolyngbya sp. GB1-A1 TaxID=2933908 RepID=UPI003297C510